MHPGQVDRQFDLAQGRRGRIHPPGADRAPARRRRGGDGVRRAGPGRHARAQDRRSASAPTTSWSIPSAFRRDDIIFDPNIFAIATGIEEHNGYGVAFIEAARWIRENLPGAHVSGGVSNLSFAFRGNEEVREAMHSVFLFHAIKAGMDMGIVNAGQMAVYDDIEPELREACEDVVLDRRADAAERLLALADRYRGQGRDAKAADLAWREWPVDKRLAHALVHGIADYIEDGRGERAAGRRAAARRDRRPADGGHERGRRPVRLRQDVPAPGRQVGAGDEAGGRLSDALHGAGEGRRRARARRRADRARHRQGRRPRHRQEHRRRRAPMQQLRGDRPRRHGAGGEDPGGRAGRKTPTSSGCPA